MKTTKDETLARQFDRFNTDVNLVFKRLRHDIPGLKKTKIFSPELITQTYTFWYMEGNTKIYIS